MFKNKLKGYINNVTILLEEEWTMLPKVIECDDDTKLMEEVKNLAAQGASKDNHYFFSHDDDRDKRVADSVDTSTVAVGEEGLETFVKNIFRQKGDELRAQFEELGFDPTEAEVLEGKLDEGKILLLHK